MHDWSRAEKIAFYSLLIAVAGVAVGLLTVPEFRRVVGLNPELVPSITKRIPFTEGVPRASAKGDTDSSGHSERIEISDPRIVKRIRFARGSTSAVVEGTIARAREHDFLLDARSEQVMTISLSSETAAFCIYTPDGSSLTEIRNVDWSGVLTQSGDYRVKIYANGQNGPYRLEVTIR